MGHSIRESDGESFEDHGTGQKNDRCFRTFYSPSLFLVIRDSSDFILRRISHYIITIR